MRTITGQEMWSYSDLDAQMGSKAIDILMGWNAMTLELSFTDCSTYGVTELWTLDF